MKHATETGRLWKFDEINARIKDIDKKLESLRALDSEQNENKAKEDSTIVTNE